MSSPPANRLQYESSPYLLQHARNPVDWYPWNEKALERARQENKPILLSIGYSACHWCHVMAQESFEDPATAAVMNDLFVNIKVDREERPDLDKIYQLAHQILVRRAGGWPLTIFLDPYSHLPIFSGTYFPNLPRYQMPAFTTILQRVADYYHGSKDEWREHADHFSAILRGLDRPGPAGTPDEPLLTAAWKALQAEFDGVNGGFGGAPKFPQVSNLGFLLAFGRRNAEHRALEIVASSLGKMAEGGLFDQLGGGFYRYSVDAAWQIPHFEKMLYDNGALLTLYAKAHAIAEDPLFRKTAEETGEWALREMQSAAGGFFSALDADSEHEEGKFYVWDRQEIESLLLSGEYPVVELHYGLDRPPNFEGHWHLHVERRLTEVAERLGMERSETARSLVDARSKLLRARDIRVRPGLDDKVLAAWNGLMIEGLAVAGRVLSRGDFLDAAERAFADVRTTLSRPGGRLLASAKNGKAHLPAYLDDYAFLLIAGLELLQSRWNTDHLRWLLELADRLIESFEDRQAGGFFFTAADHENLIHRPKSFADESMPSGNGVAARALGILGHLVGEFRYLDAAERTLRAAAGAMKKAPQAHGALLSALAENLRPRDILIVRGQGQGLAAWSAVARGAGRDWRVFSIPADAGDLPGDLASRKPEASEVAYLCGVNGCLPPLRTIESLAQLAGHVPAIDSEAM